MAKRTLAQSLSGLFMSAIGIALIVLALIIMLVRSYPVQAVLAVLAVFGCRHFMKSRSAQAGERRRAVAIACTDRQVERHRNALISYYRQSIRGDLFGNEDLALWRRHVRTFLDKQVVPELSAQSIAMDDALASELAAHVDRAVRSMLAGEAPGGELGEIDPATIDALQYEQHCAAILFRSGWTVHPTPATGDHGADVVAEKDGRRLVVQCKLYAQPVGNKAVQEVYSARPLYNCDHACVVAPAGFTAQAQRAAHSLSVRLLHHDELRSFADELASGGSARAR